MSSSSKEMSKFEKEKQKLIQEKCQGLLNDMLRDDDNKYCVDCDAKGPRWASWNLGIFLCIRCAGIHRNLGVHISRVKSVNLDSWTPEQVVTMQQMGNSRARAVYEANLPDNFRRPQTDVALENFIRAKYEHKKYIAQEWVKPPAPRVDWNAEVEEQIRKKKEKKSSSTDTVMLPPKLGGTHHHGVRANNASNNATSPSSNKISSSNNIKSIKLGKIEVPKPPVVSEAAVAPVSSSSTTTSASDDLLGLTTSAGDGGSMDPFASPVKSTNVSQQQAQQQEKSLSGEDELGAVFASDPISQQKMTKESILSLYGSMGSGGGGGGIGALAGMPASSMNNPFLGQFGGGGGGATQTTNPFPTSQQPQQGSIFSDLVGNGFAGGMGPGGAVPPQSNVSQLQQGLFSLNLGPTPGGPLPNQTSQQHPHHNSNLLFSTAPTQPTNLNVLMNPNSNPGSLGGYFGGSSGLVSQPQQPGSMVTSPPHQQQQIQNQFMQQHQQYNQFQQAAAPSQSLFQNGGGAMGGGSGGGGLGGMNSVDLLWK